MGTQFAISIEPTVNKPCVYAVTCSILQHSLSHHIVLKKRHDLFGWRAHSRDALFVWNTSTPFSLVFLLIFARHTSRFFYLASVFWPILFPYGGRVCREMNKSTRHCISRIRYTGVESMISKPIPSEIIKPISLFVFKIPATGRYGQIHNSLKRPAKLTQNSWQMKSYWG